MPKNPQAKAGTTKLADLLHIHPRFMRSVHLERDYADPSSSKGYVLTPVAAQTIGRIGAGFLPNSTQRAWRVNGDYGSGKTDFALAFARLASGRHDELPRELRGLLPGGVRFKMALATGDAEPLGATILRATGRKVDGRTSITTANILRVVAEAVSRARKGGAQGLVLLIDELGKNLEHAARHPEADDVFLLQRLAEEASRSGENALVVIVILHQGIAAYSGGLAAAARREWDKVAGRYEEIAFAQPIDQVAALVRATLHVDTARLPHSWSQEAAAAMGAAMQAGLYGSGDGEEHVASSGTALFPLHPTVLPVIVRAMRRFGQNERSLFSFLSSAEPMGLQDHCHRHSGQVHEDPFYRIHDFFEFARVNLLPSLAGITSSRTHWGVIEEVLSSTATHSDAEANVLRTIALLSLLDASDMPATRETVVLAVGGDPQETGAAVDDLQRRGVAYERGTIKGLCLWPHTSVNLDEAYSQGLEAWSSHTDGVAALCRQIASEPLVPRAYYARTGTLRYAEVTLVPADHIEAVLAHQPVLGGVGADLNVHVLVPVDQQQKAAVEKTLYQRCAELTLGHIIAVAQPIPTAVSALSDLTAWEWVRDNTPTLSGDRHAREEVRRQIEQAKRALRARLGGLDNLAVPSAPPVFQWFTDMGAHGCKPGRELLAFLGEQCRIIYPKSPRVLNELINRRQPSSAAVAARTKIAEAMATSPHKENLGMDDRKRPAEMALYLSVVREGGFHVQVDDCSGWVFRLPHRSQDKCGLLPSIKKITSVLTEAGDDVLVPVTAIFDALAVPPYGVRDGLRPIILALYLATHHQSVALYEDGTYLHSVGGEEFLRLMKEPQAFHLQHCAIEGVREEVFRKLLDLLEYRPRDPDAADLLDLVRPLALFIARDVPDYARRTNNLPAQAVAVRRALLESREPVRLVFTQLPEACGLEAVGTKGGRQSAEPKELAARLKRAMHAIRIAYPNLLTRIGDALCAAFVVTKGMPQGREIIAARASQLASAVTEPTLKSFALRLSDSGLAQSAWIESIGNLLARKSPERWTDLDEIEFLHQLETAAGRFRRTECAIIGTTRKLNGHACRIALTRSDGTEVGELVDWNGLDEPRLKHARSEIESVLDRLGTHGLAAAMEALWWRLEKKEPNKQ